jgi:TolB-like protein
MTDIFLSYSREDQAIARCYAEAFEREGLSVWWDQTLRPGEAFDEVTEKALAEAKAVVVLWSKASVGSRWVRAEATQAHGNRTLMPVMIEACKRPIMFELTHTADLSTWKGDAADPAWRTFLQDVRLFVKKEGPVAAPAVTAPTGNLSKKFDARVLIGFVALLLIGPAAFWLARAPRSVQVAASSATTAKEVTLAVLPFANLSSDAEQEYFSDGLTEEILNQLAQIDGLAVTARTSSFFFKGKNEDVRSIGQKLGVAHILEGSIRKEGNQLRITAQLVSSKDGAHQWSQTYDRELSGVFQLQEQIAKDVAQALSVKLDVGDTSRAKGGTTNLEAYDKYLQANALRSKGYDKDSTAQAVELSREAVALDPGFLQAWDQLANALRFMRVWKPESGDALRAEAEQADARIVSMAPDSGLARRIRLDRLLQQRQWLDAAILAKASAGDPAVQRSVGGFLASTGRAEEYFPIIQRGCARDPLSLPCSAALQDFAAIVGRPADAEAEYQRSKGLAGAHIQSDAIAMVRYGVGPNPDPKILLSQFLAILRDKNRPMTLDAGLVESIKTLDDARAVLRKVLDDPANRQSGRVLIIAYWAGALGDRDLALTALRQGIVDLHGEPTALWLISYSRGWRTDPRFKDILREVGLADYFRASGNWGDFCKPVGTEDFECH